MMTCTHILMYVDICARRNKQTRVTLDGFDVTAAHNDVCKAYSAAHTVTFRKRPAQMAKE